MSGEDEPLEITEDSLVVVTKRGRGRPPSDRSCASVSTWMPEEYHDRLIKMANERRISVSGLVRHLLVLQLKRF